jgi:hypothetical protein
MFAHTTTVHKYLCVLEGCLKLNRGSLAGVNLPQEHVLPIPAIAHVELWASEIRDAKGMRQPNALPASVIEMYSFRTLHISEIKAPAGIQERSLPWGVGIQVVGKCSQQKKQTAKHGSDFAKSVFRHNV